MRKRELVCVPARPVKIKDRSGGESARETERQSPTRNRRLCQIVKSALVLGTSVAMLLMSVKLAKAGDASPSVQIPQDEAPHHDATGMVVLQRAPARV